MTVPFLNFDLWHSCVVAVHSESTYCPFTKILLLDLVKIIPEQVSFYSDEVPAFQANDGEVYAAANRVLRNIGFNEERVKAIRIKWRDDEVVSKGGRNFNLFSKGGIQSTYCLPRKILPLALAKISITPELKCLEKSNGNCCRSKSSENKINS